MIFDKLFFLNKTKSVIPTHMGIQDNKIKKIKNMM